MANTGKQRSLTVTINKTVAGVQQDSYPHIYQGKGAFAGYDPITELQLSTMPITAYEQRLADFKAYVESQELGLEFDTDTVVGFEPYRINETACPII